MNWGTKNVYILKYSEENYIIIIAGKFYVREFVKRLWVNVKNSVALVDG